MTNRNDCEVITNPRSYDTDLLIGQSKFRSGDYQWIDHRVFDWTLLMTLDGEGTVNIDGEDFLESKGTILLAAPAGRRSFKTDRPWNLLWFHFQMPESISSTLSWPSDSKGVFRVKLDGRNYRKSASALLEALDLSIMLTRGWHRLAQCLIESVVFRCNGAASSVPDFDPQVAKAQKMLLNLKKDWSVDEVARQCGMSRSIFYSQFKRAVGVSPRLFRETHALRYAQILLESTSMPIGEIAARIGMPSVFYFSSRFKKLVGVSPSLYRKRKRSDGADVGEIPYDE